MPQGWERRALARMVGEVARLARLPDLDVPLNAHDEPRVAIPRGVLDGLVSLGREARGRSAARAGGPRNAFSAAPGSWDAEAALEAGAADDGDDGDPGQRMAPATDALFNDLAHQNPWTHAILSCGPGSPAHNLSAAAAPLPRFTTNLTAASDACARPRLAAAYGLYQRPNALSLTLLPVPIFSHAAPPSFADLPFPSPWYWAAPAALSAAPRAAAAATPWGRRARSAFWRGSTTGSFSRAGTWRTSHRQRLVAHLAASPRLRAPGRTCPSRTSASATPADCAAQRRGLRRRRVAPPRAAGRPAAPPRRARRRRQRHVGPVPRAARGGRRRGAARRRARVVVGRPAARVGALRAAERRGRAGGARVGRRSGLPAAGWRGGGAERAREMGERGRAWAGGAGGREVDVRVWVWRVLLEWARVLDDRREEIGFDG